MSTNPVIVRNVTWTPDPDGEYGCHTAEYKGHRLEVNSDKDGDNWAYVVDDGETRWIEDSGMFGAMLAAMRDAEG